MKRLHLQRISPSIALVGLLLAGIFPVTPGEAQVVPPLSLKDVPAVVPTNLPAFLKATPEAKQFALVLGKALFWDMQVGSDNVKACASCHFNAGTDVREQKPTHHGV